MQRQIIAPGRAIVNFRLQSHRRLLRIVTGSVRGARNPSPTRQRHNLLHFIGTIADALARGVQKYSCAPPEHPLRAERTGMLESVLLRRVVVREGPQKKELAPGGHQEQGESRVTEFRAPDLEKHRVPKWQSEQQQPLSAKSISGGM